MNVPLHNSPEFAWCGSENYSELDEKIASLHDCSQANAWNRMKTNLTVFGISRGIENGVENANNNGMRSTIDSAGRIVLPKAIREAARLEGGTEVEVRIEGDHLEIEPVPAVVDFVKKGDFVVAVPKGRPERKLTGDVVEETRSQIYRERAEGSRET